MNAFQITLIVLGIYLTPIILYFLWYQYKLGCLEKNTTSLAAYYFQKKHVEIGAGVVFWPMIGPFLLFVAIIAAPFTLMRKLGKKHGCDIKL